MDPFQGCPIAYCYLLTHAATSLLSALPKAAWQDCEALATGLRWDFDETSKFGPNFSQNLTNILQKLCRNLAEIRPEIGNTNTNSWPNNLRFFVKTPLKGDWKWGYKHSTPLKGDPIESLAPRVAIANSDPNCCPRKCGGIYNPHKGIFFFCFFCFF